MNDLGLEKTALLGKLLSAGISKGIGAIGSGVGRAGMGIGKGLWGLGTGASNTIGKGIGSFGTGLLNSAGKAGLPAGATKTIGTLGKGLGGDMASFGLLTGGMDAALANPGDRLQAFGRGALMGGLGGAAWGVGRNAARMGLTKAMGQTARGASRFGKMEALAEPGFFGALPQGASRLKSMGAKTLTGGVPLAAAFGVSSFVPGGHPGAQQQQQQRQPFYARPHTYYPAAAMMNRGRLGLTPGGGGYGY